MDGTEDCGDRADSETVAALRARLALLTPGSPERREAEADLAGVLVDEAWRAAGRTDGAGTDVDEQEWERQVRCLLAEPEELLGRLLAAGPAAPGHRRLCWLSVQAARLRWEVGGGPRALDAYVDWAEQAAAPAGAYGAEEPAPAGIVAATCELAEALLLRWRSVHGDGSSAADRDRVVALLAPVLAGPDAGLVPLPATAHAHLGLALSGRCRGPHHATAAALADRAAAIAHLGAAHDAHQAWESSGGGSGEELPPGLADAVVMDLATLRWAAQADLCEQYGDRGETAPASETAAELTALLALLRPLLADPTEDGGSAAELGADIADLLAAHVPDAAGQRAAVAAYRDALAHPALAPDERRRAGLNLGLVLGERAERNASGQTPGDPAPHEDRADALAVLGPALDAAEDREERLAGLAAAVQVGFALLEEGRLDRAGLDRLAAEARELADGVAPDDGDRAEIMLKAGIALSQRAFAAAAPHSGALGEQVLRDGTPDPALAVERLAPQVAADLRDAVALLRTGTGLYHYQDGLYVAAVTALGNALVLDFTIRLPEVRLPVLYDGLRVLRVALEQLTPDDELYGDQGLVHVFLTALMYRIWYSGPFADAHSDGAGPALPDVAGHASVEDDLQLLSGMLESRTGQAEPAVVLVSALVAAIRAADGDPASDELRSWQLPLLHAAGRTAPEEGALQIVMLAVSGAFGLLLDRGGEASAAERAAAFDALRRARALLAPGSALAGRIAALLQETGADPRAVLGLILGRAAAPQQPPARPAAPPAGGDHPDPAGAGRGAARGPVLRPPSAAPDTPGAGNADDDHPDPADRDHHGARPGAARQPVLHPSPAAPDTPGTGNADDDHPGRHGTRRKTAHGPVSRPSSVAPDAPGIGGVPALDPRAAVLLGDGSADPFVLPAGRVLERVGQAAGMPEAVIAALAHYQRWLRERDGADLAAAIARAGQAAAAAAPGGGPLADRCSALLAGLLLDRHLLLGDHADLAAAHAGYTRLLERVPPDAAHPALPALLGPAAEGVLRTAGTAPGAFHAELLAAAGTTGLLLGRLRGRDAGAAGSDPLPLAYDRLRAAAALLPPDHPRLPAVRSEIALQDLESAVRSADPAAAGTAADAAAAAALACAPDSVHRPALLLRAAEALHTADALGGTARKGLGEGTARAVALLREAAGRGGLGYHGARARLLYGLGWLLLAGHRDPADRTGPDEAVAALQEARMAVNTAPGDPFAIALARTLAVAHRALAPHDRAHRRRSREAAKSVLTAHGRAVLLQTGALHGLEAAREVGPDMLRLARWCLEDCLPEAAAEALELGRGLVLHAATVDATVPGLLRDAGHGALAAEWDAAAGAAAARGAGQGPAAPGAGASVLVPDDLRRRVLEALAGGSAERRLLSAPAPAQVGRALRRVGADALVHLVPGEGGPGHAVLVTATGEVGVRALPGLAEAAGGRGPLAVYAGALRAFQEAGRAEDRPALTDPPVMHTLHRQKLAGLEQAWRRALEEVCAWAGGAAMGEVLGWAAQRWPGRPPRLVLAPAGPLGMVPWHAARLPAAPGAPAAYACERAVVSYCATARQLVDLSARRRMAPGEGPAVLVVDPGGSAAMHREAALLRTLLHPRAVVVGGPDAVRDGAGTGPAPLPATRAAVDPFLPGRGATSAALTYVNCHADTGDTPARSRLRLTAAESVTVEDLLAGAMGRDPGAPGGVVTLANCTSDLALSDHDEALTLATAFLAAGAAAVVGSRWSVVDDRRTTLMMCVYHHHLDRGAPPADALRTAQLWMLDPDRVPPPGLAALAAAAPGAEQRPLDDLEVWASFAHQGH